MPQLELFSANPPARRSSPTSLAAAAAIRPSRQRMVDQVYAFVLDQHKGATYEEISLALPMCIQSVCARMNDLKKAGKVKPNGARRPTTRGRSAAVWVALTEE